MIVREYGDRGPQVILLHGGPGGPGYMAPVGRALSRSFRVLEPMQRRSGGDPLTVAQHVADLSELIETRCSGTGDLPSLVGSSWGAMLALAYAAENPEPPLSIVLIGCGTFDAESRSRYKTTVDSRMTPEVRARLDRLKTEVADSDERFRQQGEAVLPLYCFDPVTTDLELLDADRLGNRDTWDDMVRLQEEGIYPATFTRITAPVLMIHGDHDPHPGPMTRALLEKHLPALVYHELARCGHYPWLERYARDEFFEVLSSWLMRQVTG